ncbi:hypothetical protein JCGZ_02479 [Jatropha curcas]|uniref:Aminotransferase-like plant mobile domain-containing protein n=1 Tax=Jatropha curcas TaxID=180498 RepID=A0A067L213_JATCU|nr:hypothetical protein JCGZ_02479 [Jatropha curcas]
MSQISEIPAFAYTPEIEILGALPDIPTFDGEPVPVSRNPLTPEMRPLQLLPLPGLEFPIRYETSQMRGFRSEVNLGKARSGGSATDASAFWDLLDPPIQARVVAAVRSLLGVTTQTRYTVQGCMSYEMVFRFWALSLEPWDCEAWRTYPGREVAELHTRSRLLMRGYWADRYFLGERVFDTPIAPAQWRVPHAPPRHMCLLEGLNREDLEVEYRGFSANDFLSAGDFPSYFAARMQARLPEVLEYIQVPAQRYQEICQRFGFARSYIGRLYSERHELELENGRLQRHQTRQSSAVSLLQAEVERLRMRLEVEARLIPTYGPAVFQSRSRRRFDFGGNLTIRWTCPWWRIRVATIGSMNLNYVLYASLDRSMAYFPDRISRQYGMIQRVPQVHNFKSGLITSHLLTNLADRWQSRKTVHLDEGMMQDTVTPAYANWFFTLQ